MSFSGKYQLESQEGFVEFMKAIGLPDDLIEKGKDIKSVTEIEENGDQFKVTITTGAKVMINSFTIGQETEIESLTGEKIKVTLRSQTCMHEFTSHCIDDNAVVCTLTLGSLVYKRISKRLA
uniref:Fatty acid binding protein 1-B.1-like n=1 Tax=Sinocyclocheilus rhinocerous TaxID=307959 RepID=A0A673FVD0_9TELE